MTNKYYYIHMSVYALLRNNPQLMYGKSILKFSDFRLYASLSIYTFTIIAYS